MLLDFLLNMYVYDGEEKGEGTEERKKRNIALESSLQ
jgi:hypothetical protein